MAALAILMAAAPVSAQEPAKPINPLTDTSVYPVAVWAMGDRTAPAFAEMGVNIFVGDPGNDATAGCDSIAKHGCMAFIGWEKYAKDEAKRKAIAASPGFLGWMHGDEPDNPGVVDGEFLASHIPPSKVIADYQAMKASSTPAPMYLNLGIGLAVGDSQSTPDEVYKEFMKSADILCYDVYPVSTQDEGVSRLHLVARGMSRLKAFAGDKPAWIWLECTAIGGEKPGIGIRAPYPHELRAEVWMSILHGADGIGYFPHQFTPYKGGPAAIPEDIQKEMKLTNRLLHKLAPTLRTGKKQMLKVEAGATRVDAMLWQKDSDVLIVAVNMKNAPAEAIIPVPVEVKEFTVVGQDEKAKVTGGGLVATLKPYEVRLFWTGAQLINQSYRYVEPPKAEAIVLEDRTIDFEGDLPQGAELKGNARVVEDQVHGGKKALFIGEMGEALIPLSPEDHRGKVTLWVYDSSKKHSSDDEDKPATGTCWGLQDSAGRMMLCGIIRRSFLSQAAYSYVFTDKLRGYPSPGFTGNDRTKAGWYQWEFDLSESGKIAVRVNGKAADMGKNYASFDKGFNAIRIVGGDQGEFEDIYIDDITVEYPKAVKAKPGKLADLPFQRDLRKGVRWSRTQHSVVAAAELTEAPVIDGKLTDPGWVNAETLATFTHVDGSDTASYQTVGVIGRREGKLYLAFRCVEDFVDEIVTGKAAGWQNDCLEIFLDPDNKRTSQTHIVITADGRATATRTVQDEWGEGRRDETWKPTLVAKTARVVRGWTAEVELDLKELGDTVKNPVWGFDVGRERKPLPAENSVYTLGGFQQAFYFGGLAFDVEGPVTLADGKLRNRSDQPVDAMVHVLVSAPEHGVQFPTWQDRWRDVASELVVYKLPAQSSKTSGGLTLLDRDLELKVPAGGRIRFTLLNEKGQAVLWEEFIANPFGGTDLPK